MQGITTGDITTVMTSHTVCKSYDKPVFMVQCQQSLEIVITDKMVIHQYHVLILISHTTNPAG
jgi:hypothetical protein